MISQIRPELLVFFLKNIRIDKEFSKASLVEKRKKKGELGERDPTLISELSNTLSLFGFLEKCSDGNCFKITKKGNDFKSILLRNEKLFFELFHIVKYFSFELNSNNFLFLPFESYRYLSNIIYFNKNNITKKELANDIDSRIKEKYKVIGSFSDICISRGFAWLKCLSPNIFGDDNLIEYRTPEYLEPIILSLYFIYKIRKINIGDPIFLDDKLKNEISIPNFINKLNIESLLMEVAKKHDDKLDFKYNISGSYVILKKDIEISDLR